MVFPWFSYGFPRNPIGYFTIHLSNRLTPWDQRSQRHSKGDGESMAATPALGTVGNHVQHENCLQMFVDA